jgi:hypothetical protein
VIWKVGDYYYRDDYEGLPIYGEIVASPYADDNEELARQGEHLHRGYSKAAPEGELGMMPRNASDRIFCKIDAKLFTMAQRLGWPDLATTIEAFDNDYV